MRNVHHLCGPVSHSVAKKCGLVGTVVRSRDRWPRAEMAMVARAITKSSLTSRGRGWSHFSPIIFPVGPRAAPLPHSSGTKCQPTLSTTYITQTRSSLLWSAVHAPNMQKEICTIDVCQSVFPLSLFGFVRMFGYIVKTCCVRSSLYHFSNNNKRCGIFFPKEHIIFTTARNYLNYQ